MDREYYNKKFSVGLVLDTSIEEFRDFLDDYGWSIDSFYFSLPLGRQFHSRKIVAEQFNDIHLREQFWKQLEMIASHGIKLEVLFNTHELVEEDIERGYDLLLQKNIQVDKVGLVDEHYNTIKRLFPEKTYVYSFNNFPDTPDDYFKPAHHYDEYVIGRKFLRNKALIDRIHEQPSAKTILLVNNGCSHFCKGCSIQGYCCSVHQKARGKYSQDELYAIQSFMPFELGEGKTDPRDVDFMKINSRNASIAYLRKCIHSYIFGNERKLVEDDPRSFGLWAHLTWFVKDYSALDFDRIVQYKQKIYEGRESV